MSYIKWLADIRFRENNEFGSKACNLGVIASQMRKTPLGFCLSANAYINTLRYNGILEQVEALAQSINIEDLENVEKISSSIRAIIMNVPISEKIQKELNLFYEELVKEKGKVKVAVRSSAIAEDLPSASFAGQLESYLDVEDFSNILESIKKCWASLWTSRAIHYRFQKGIGQLKISMAVIIQEMVPAQVAGVMFTANPISNARDEYYIEAVKGLGESLVLGQVDADRYIVKKEGIKITSKELVTDTPYLDDFNITFLADEGRKIDMIYSEFQDVEWAYYKGEIYILQTRPITTLEEEELDLLDVKKMTPIQRDIWVNVNERYPEPVLPIDGIVAKLYYRSLFSAYNSLGFKVPLVDWKKVEEGFFPEGFRPPAIKVGFKRIFKVLDLTNRDIKEAWQENENILNRYLNLLNKVKEKDFPIEITLEYLEDALKDFERNLTFRYAIYIQYTTLYGIFGKLLNMLYGPEGQKYKEDLVVGHPQVTMELNNSLSDLVSKAHQIQEIREIILSADENDIISKLEKSEKGLEFIEEFKKFLEKYGDRELSQGLGGIASPTWKEQPEIVWGMLKGALLARSNNAAFHSEAILKRREDAEKNIKELKAQGLGRLIPSKWAVNKLIDASKKYNAFREDSHYYLTRAMSIFRQLFLVIGDKLVRRGLLEKKQDIFYLSYFEVKEIVYALYNLQKVSKLELEEKIQTRKIKQERRKERWLARNIEINIDEEGVLKGIGSSRGKITGPCKVITNPKDLSRLRAGDILVAQYTNPSWTPVFSFIGGLVVEYGGTISHAAIIAREYGLPAVMGVSGVTRVLKDGDIISIDGAKGLVKIEKH